MPSSTTRIERISAGLLLSGFLALAPVVAQAQGQCWQLDICQLNAPIVSFNVATSVSVSTVQLSVDFSDPDEVNLPTKRLWRNGVEISTWYDGVTGPSSGNFHFSAEFAGPFSLVTGSNTLIAEICDGAYPTSCGRDTVTITYTPPPPPPPTAKPLLTPMQRSDTRDLDAEAVTYDYATTPYFTLDTPRGVGLHYSSATARASAEIHVDAVIRSSQIPSVVSVRVTRSDNVEVFPEKFFVGDTGVLRLAAKFSESCAGVTACSKSYRVAVRAYYGNVSTFETDSLSSVRVLIQDESASRLGAGWTVAGLERLWTDTTGIVVTDGAGHLEYFAKASCTGSGATETCDYTSPIGDLSVLKRTPAHPVHGTRFFRAYKNGDTTFFDNSGLVRVARTRFSAGTMRFAWSSDALGARIDTIVDPMGKAIRLSYEPLSGGTYRNGSLRWITLPDNRTTGVRVSSGLGDLTQVDGPDGLADVIATYDGSTHRLSSFVLRVGGGSLAYDAQDKAAKVLGVAVALEAGGTGADSVLYQSLTQRALVGSSSTYASVTTKPLRADSAYSRSTMSNGAEVNLWRHALGGAAMVRSRGATGDTTITRNTYNGLGQLIASSVTGRAPTLYGYDNTYGTLSTMVNSASGEMKSVTSGPYGQPMLVHVNGVLQSQAFFSGASLSPDSVRADTANTTHLKYDAYGRVTSVRDPRQASDSSIYDSTTGNLASSRSSAPGHSTRVSAVTHDASGRVIQSTDHLGRVVTQAYDALNRPVMQVVIGADTSIWTYNDVSRLYTFRDPNSNVYQTQLNAAGWTLSETDPYGATLSFGYDRLGNVVRATDRRGQIVRWYKDLLGRDTLRVAGSDTARFAYDPAKRWVAVRNAESIDTVATDAAGRASSWVSVRGGIAFVSTRGWIGSLPDGVTFQASSGGSILWTRTMGATFDAARRARTVVDFTGGSTQTTFDKAGARSTVTLPSSAGTRANTFSTRSELIYTSFTGSGAALTRTYFRDASSRIGEVLQGYQGDSYSRVHNYDSRDRLMDYRDTHTWTETTWEAGDPFGECPGCFVQVDITHVDTLRSGAYTYDKISNLIGSGITYSAAGRSRLTGSGGETFSYDAEGNLLQRSGGAMGTVQYHWNALGQLDTVKVIGGATTSYGYDGFGQRVRKTVNGSMTRYLVHDGQLAMELTSGGAIVAEYTYYPGTDRPHGMRRGGVQYFYAQDAQGNVIGLLNSSGVVVEGYVYTPQGVLVAGGTSVVNPLRYKGREWDAEAGLYYMRARYYDPVVGRFISEDPIGLAGGVNPYAFALSDWVNYADPTGLDRCDPAHEARGYESIQDENGEWWCRQPLPSVTIGGSGRVYYGDLFNLGRGSCGLCGAGGQEFFRQMAGLAPAIEYELIMFLPSNAIAAATGVGATAALDAVSTRIAARMALKGLPATVKELNKISHVFPRAEKNLAALVKASGGSELRALRAIQAAADRALAAGRLATDARGILPGGGIGNILSVNGVRVQLIGGRVVNGAVELGSFAGLP